MLAAEELFRGYHVAHIALYYERDMTNKKALEKPMREAAWKARKAAKK